MRQSKSKNTMSARRREESEAKERLARLRNNTPLFELIRAELDFAKIARSMRRSRVLVSNTFRGKATSGPAALAIMRRIEKLDLGGLVDIGNSMPGGGS